MLQDTIAAISTAAVDGAISIIRMSGDAAIQIVDSLCSIDLTSKKSHTISYGFILDPITKEEIDEVLVSVFRAPKTFTREDIVEINCHGGRYVTKKILQLCLMQGARLAEPGEFTRRAFLNGRIDLTQAEAINDMILADSNESRKLAMHGIRGSVKKLLEPFIKNILDIIANIEVNIDYPEYDDVEMLSNEVILPKIQKWLSQIDQLLERAESGQMMKEGIKTVFIKSKISGFICCTPVLTDFLRNMEAEMRSLSGETVRKPVFFQNRMEQIIRNPIFMSFLKPRLYSS